MIYLAVRNLVRQFDRSPVFQDVTFDVKAGDRIGLVGQNGTGKSTLLRCIIGEDHQDSGEVTSPKGVTVAMLEQEPDFDDERTLREEARAGLQHLYDLQHEAEEIAHKMAEVTDPAEQEKLHDRYDHLQEELLRKDAYNVDYRIDEVLHGLGFADEDYDRPIASFSGGQQNRILLGRMLLRAPDVMLLDEPTNHLDIESTEWLENFLTKENQSFILVSHDRYFLDRVCNRTIELHKSKATLYKGNFTAYRQQREEQAKLIERAVGKQQDFIEKTQRFIDKNKYGLKSKQAQDRVKKLERMEEVESIDDFEEVQMRFGDASRTGDLVIEAKGLTKGYDGETLFEDLSFRIHRGERFGLVGPNGCGKSTLLKAILDVEPADAGSVRIGANVEIGYYDQQLSSVSPEDVAMDAVRPPKGLDFSPGQCRSMLARFGVKSELHMEKIGTMSGGEKSRVALAKLAALSINVMVLDEPTNHLDLWARDSLEKALKQFNGTLLFVSHDRYFLDQIADHVIVWDHGTWRLHEGNYSDYVAFRDSVQNNKQPTTKKSPEKKPAKETANNQSKTKTRKFPFRKVSEIEADIASHEELIESLEADMVQPEVLADPKRAKTVQDEYSQAKANLAQLMEHWEEAAELDA
ncbi:ribosomal protection-like ABC-F family protein [Calycomorphotria hydatis]|uniref:Putative ABC transporter ATP-binding protein n=1 Tax=Calycomorphotria hydatis TaxID=2528027 RepID=A0A517TFE4_9PLAN|nr:ABC-F family ATP-binding cassette domain-containing protein [Calycomorphotria hydatis]QDT67082.1 putative ABC transporter ATP-binding protein [Calycomorphotria hydatis]